MKALISVGLLFSFAIQNKARADSQNTTDTTRGSKAQFIELSPVVEDVEIRKGNPFIEVFVTGIAELDCYDVREYAVEKAEKSTLILPRFRRSNPDKPCSKTLKKFSEKAADLDPANPASYEVEVLGYYGWHKRSLSKNP